MKYADAESIGLASDDKHTQKLAWAYLRALETLFQIATGTSSSESSARYCLKQLGIFEPDHSIDMGYLMGYDANEAARCLREGKQVPRPCLHADGTYRIPRPTPLQRDVLARMNWEKCKLDQPT